MKETGADVIGLDWRIPLDAGLAELGYAARCREISIPCCSSRMERKSTLARKTCCDRPPAVPATSSISATAFLPETPVENVKDLSEFVHEHSADDRVAAKAER